MDIAAGVCSMDGVSPGFSAKFSITAPLTLENFVRALGLRRPARYFFEHNLLVSLILGTQLVLCTLAAYAFFVRYEFRGKNVVFALVLVQLMSCPTSCWSKTQDDEQIWL